MRHRTCSASACCFALIHVAWFAISACGTAQPAQGMETEGTLAVASGGSSGTAEPSAGTAGATMAGAAVPDAAAGSSGAAAAAGGSTSAAGGHGGDGGAPPTAGASGTASASDGGNGGSGGDGGGGGSSGCTRELLKGTVDAYFRALAARDPASLPLAGDVKFTENGEAMELGASGLWKTAGMVKHTQSALDLEACSSATHAVVPDGTMDIPVALRLKLAARRISEIETIAVRPGDYKILGSTFASNPGAIISANTSVKWEQPVPSDQRNTHAEIGAWIDKYFRIFPRGVCDVTSDCKRLENGGGSFDCDFGASCAAGPPSMGAPALDPRLILVDDETGIGVGFTMFMGNTDMHMYKMYGGEVHAVHAILGAASGSGWD